MNVDSMSIKPNFTFENYIGVGGMTLPQAEVLRQAIINRENILVVGGTSSGKTTFCNALLYELFLLRPSVRMFIFDEVLELKCFSPAWASMSSAGWKDVDRFSMVVNDFRPDCLTVNEVRSGGPALALLKLWNTGHPGGFATVHANSARGGLTRMDQLIQEVSVNPQRILIGEAVNYAVFLERTNVGRRIKEIVKVRRYDPMAQEFEVEAVVG